MFALPRSSWADYDAKLISKGGGVFPRTEKIDPAAEADPRCSASMFPRSSPTR
jgi:NAD-specific glutamate dehydrogenase